MKWLNGGLRTGLVAKEIRNAFPSFRVFVFSFLFLCSSMVYVCVNRQSGAAGSFAVVPGSRLAGAKAASTDRYAHTDVTRGICAA